MEKSFGWELVGVLVGVFALFSPSVGVLTILVGVFGSLGGSFLCS